MCFVTFIHIYIFFIHIFLKKISLKNNCKEEGIAVFMLSSQEENLHGVHLLLDTVFCDLLLRTRAKAESYTSLQHRLPPVYVLPSVSEGTSGGKHGRRPRGEGQSLAVSLVAAVGQSPKRGQSLYTPGHIYKAWFVRDGSQGPARVQKP